MRAGATALATLAIFLTLAAPHAQTWGRPAAPIAPATITDLQAAIDAAADGDTIRLGPGLYYACPEPFFDPLCGNCTEHRTGVDASTGFCVVGKSLTLIGSGPDQTTLSTGAGYGIYIEDSDHTTILDLAVTGGRRDPDGNATDAAIVVRRSRVVLENLHLRDNTNRAEDVVVGIGGVMGREGAEIEIRDCRILNNGWDGVALYRGATATIADNVIEIGRGAGIGITWDAVAVVLRNRVSGYWKGIGSFGQSRAIVRNNAVFDNLGWGIIATGSSTMEATHNVVARNGNCGFAVWGEEATGIAVNNIIVDNGWRKEWVCPRVGFWHLGKQTDFPARFNLVQGNAAGAWLSEKGEEPSGLLMDQAPLFRDPVDFRLRCGSPAVDAGDTTRTDCDGSRSDLGVTGGPAARSSTGAAPPPLLPVERLRAGSAAWVEASR